MSSLQSPFDIIVIISPDSQSTHAVRELVTSSWGGFIGNVLPAPTTQLNVPDMEGVIVLQAADGKLLICTCDPYGCKMGSGGGVIAALAAADEVHRYVHAIETKRPRAPPTVLLCRADRGDCSEFPTQIVLGKAWTSLPSWGANSFDTHGVDGKSSLSSTKAMSNPTSELITSLFHVFHEVPQGTIVVAAASNFSIDSNNYQNMINFDDLDNSHVIGLSVPVPIEAADNQRVFELEHKYPREGWQVQRTRDIAKPHHHELTGSINMNETSDFQATAQNRRSNLTFMDKCALHTWLVTGVFAFLPDAASTLRRLSQSSLKRCTRRGLGELHQEAVGMERIKGNPLPSLEEFAQNTALKICLYEHILSAFHTSPLSSSGTEKGGIVSASQEVSQELSQHELYTCTLPAGLFLHFHTTGSFIGWIMVMRRVSSVLSNCFLSGFDLEQLKECAVMNSVLVSNGYRDSIIGKGSIVEHCHIECEGRIEIEERCLVSGIRGLIRGSSLHIPSGLCLQLLPLHQARNQNQMNSFVCICIGIDDAISNKRCKTLFGLTLDQNFLERSSLGEGDLWDATIPMSDRLLWNAKIHPILAVSDDGTGFDLSFLNWIRCLKESRGINGHLTSEAVQGLRQWHTAERLSLSEIGDLVDAAAEARYRSSVPWNMFSEMGR